MIKCPKCGSNKDIRVTALVTVRLIFDKDGNLEESETVDNDHEWDGLSRAKCHICEYAGTAVLFDI